MTAIPSIKHAARKAHNAFGSDANTQLAIILIFVIVGFIASMKLVVLAEEKGSFRCPQRDWPIGAHSCDGEPTS